MEPGKVADKTNKMTLKHGFSVVYKICFTASVEISTEHIGLASTLCHAACSKEFVELLYKTGHIIW